jgi:tRNA1Val (adenine37-N6)-methyltransferase
MLANNPEPVCRKAGFELQTSNMPNSYFQFKQFMIQQDRCAMKVTTDACLFGSLLPTSSGGGGARNVLDIGTGTALLSLMYAQKNNKAVIDAIEIDEDAYRQAKENAGASPWKDRITIIHADAKSYPFSKKYDCIMSNPPFYENELKAENIKKNIAHHNDGLSLDELLSVIQKNLEPGSLFFLLLPYKRNAEIRDLILKHKFDILQMTFVRQSVNHDYFRIMLAGKLRTDELKETMINEISIWDDKQQYTTEFTALLKDYYLHL